MHPPNPFRAPIFLLLLTLFLIHHASSAAVQPRGGKGHDFHAHPYHNFTTTTIYTTPVVEPTTPAAEEPPAATPAEPTAATPTIPAPEPTASTTELTTVVESTTAVVTEVPTPTFVVQTENAANGREAGMAMLGWAGMLAGLAVMV